MIHQQMFGAARATFDNRIKITGPAFAEDPMQVPIAFDASALGKVERVVVVVDRNPIRKVLEFEPMRLRPALSFRFKLQEASPVRVAARTQDGVWHVGTFVVDATGGGCTLPGATRKDATWSTTLNQVESRVFPDFNGAGSRIRLRVMHPMDTGLVAGIPAFHIEQLDLLDARRQPMLRLALYEPVAENPIFSFDLDAQPLGQPAHRVTCARMRLPLLSTPATLMPCSTGPSRSNEKIGFSATGSYSASSSMG